MNVGHVQNGTHAGWKIQKPAPKPWTCACEGINFLLETPQPAKFKPAYLSRCTDCGTRRP